MEVLVNKVTRGIYCRQWPSKYLVLDLLQINGNFGFSSEIGLLREGLDDKTAGVIQSVKTDWT